MSTRKALLAVAALLLLVGAGCGSDVPPYQPIQNAPDYGNQPPAQPAPTQPTSQEEKPTGLAADVDATADAALQQAESETTTAMDENSDASVMTNDEDAITAYGQAYDQSALQ